MKRRITSMLLAAAMTITMLTGCGSQGKETEKTDTGAIVLDMYHSWSTDSERGAALDKLIQEFNKEYEGKIEVKVTINPDFPAYQEKVKTMISTDTTPDIFHYNFNPNDLSRQKSGKLMDFSEYMDDEWRARFGEGDLENLTIDGEITSIPFEKAGAVFYYNKEVFEKAGINCKVNPVTTEEYIKMMNVVQAKRPENSQLSKAKLNSVGIEIPTWEDALDRYLKIELNK